MSSHNFYTNLPDDCGHCASQAKSQFIPPSKPAKIATKERAQERYLITLSHAVTPRSIPRLKALAIPERQGHYSRNPCTLFNSSASSRAETARTPASVPKHRYSHNYRHVSNLSTRICSTTQDLPQHHVRPLGRTVRIASVQEQESMLGIESHRFLLAAASRLALSTSHRGLASSGSMAVHNRRCYCPAVCVSRPS